MRCLGLATIKEGNITLNVQLPSAKKELEESFRRYVSDRLKRNRLVRNVLEELNSVPSISTEELSNHLEDLCPYISANEKTWKTYGRIIADWMDFTDLAIFEPEAGIISPFPKGDVIRDRRPRLTRARTGEIIPLIQYEPIKRTFLILAKAAVNAKEVPDWTTFRQTTVQKALAMLEHLDFIERKAGRIIIKPRGIAFAISKMV
jgi:hypothetical protein